MSPISSNTIVLPSGETSSESQVPSSVVNSILRSGFKGRPFFSSFFSGFFSSFFSSCLPFSWSAASCRLVPALLVLAPPKKTPANIANTRSHVATRRLGCFALMPFPPLHCQTLNLESMDRQRRGQSACRMTHPFPPLGRTPPKTVSVTRSLPDAILPPEH